MPTPLELIPIDADMHQNTLQVLAKWAGLDETPFGELIYRARLNDLDKVVIVQELTERGYTHAQVGANWDSRTGTCDFVRAVRHG